VRINIRTPPTEVSADTADSLFEVDVLGELRYLSARLIASFAVAGALWTALKS
jgi:hypothetical protein